MAATAEAISDVAEGKEGERPAREVELYPGPPSIRVTVPAAPWARRDRAAWHWPRRMTADVWAARYVRLTKTAIPGPWRADNAPYQRGILRLATKRGVERLTIMKGAQLGGSEAMRILMGYWAFMDPKPMGLALPNKDKGREIVENDVLPFFRANFGRTRELAQLLSSRLHDMKKGQLKLSNGFIIHLMWSGSVTSMASNPMGRAISDEVEKFAAWVGEDADPVSAIDYRLRTYPERMHILLSTPTNADGPINTHFLASQHQLYYLVPCQHCGLRQRLLFGEGRGYGVRWSEAVRALRREGRYEAAAALIRRDAGACWYQCVGCHGPWTESQKRAAVRAGTWATVGSDRMTAGGEIADAEAMEEFPPGTTLGLQIGSLYACWESWTMAHVAAEFLQARTLAQKFAFRTSTLGEPWEQAAERVEVESVASRSREATLAEGVLPRWTGRVVGVIDTQKDHFWMVIRAWGPGMRSQRVWHGKVQSFAELEQWMRTPWQNEDPRQAARGCDLVLIDSGGTRKFEDEEANDDGGGGADGSRVMEVYAWVLRNAALVRAIKGDARPTPGVFMRPGRGVYVTGRTKKPVPIWLLDVHHFHDELADLMGRRDEVMAVETGEVTGTVPAWGLNTRADEEYDAHLAAMHKVAEAQGGRGGLVYRWRPVRDGLRVDYRACEAYQVAGAYLAGAHLLPDMPAYLQAIEQRLAAEAAARAAVPTPGFTTPGGQSFLASNRR